ncbi:MAG: hypothetical protein HY302_13660 [Opitutae bacterium]|nr:hypothetical protein [Opitutae bacterium]
MKPFRYALDPAGLLGCALYAANRWLARPHGAAGFMHDQFDDLWLIPAALPLLLWVQRRLALRGHDHPPTWPEIGLHLAVWSVAAEGLAPLLFKRATGDIKDVAAYAVGAGAACLWWQYRRRA